jgi:hypothetical protein
MAAVATATTLTQVALLTAATYVRGDVVVWVDLGRLAFFIQAVFFVRLVMLAWWWARRPRPPNGGEEPNGGEDEPRRPPPRPTGRGIIWALITGGVSLVSYFALEYFVCVPPLGTFDALYCALGTLATVRASLEGYVDPGSWRIIAMVQEGVDIIFMTGAVALGLAKVAALQNHE